jgi:hypothetical protein
VAARRVRLQPKSRTRQEEHSFASSYAFLLIRNLKVEIRNNLTPIPVSETLGGGLAGVEDISPHSVTNVDKLAACNLSSRSLYFSQGIPCAVTEEIKGASQYFDRIEVWRKSEVDKDPIAVGVMGGERYLIARWGMEKLIPFDTIKKRMPLVRGWKYATHPLGIVAGLAGLGYLVWSILM